MGLVAQLQGDVAINGRLTPTSLTIPAGSVGNASIASGSNVDTDKVEARVYSSWAQPNSAATAETRTLFVAKRAGTITSFLAGSIAKAVGDSTVTIDVRKNGTTILSSTIVLDNANTARVAEDGTLNGAATAFVAGDWFEVVITISAGTGTLPTGVFAQLEARQNAT
jgi:hypothetical protein